jgi:hypothetical protein
MNKNQKIVFFLSILLLLFAVSFLWYSGKQDNVEPQLPPQTQPGIEDQQALDEPPPYNLTTAESGDWDAPFTKQIEVVFATEEEKEQMGINVSPLFDPARIQVLERDADGNVITYKKIYNDSEIIHELYLPTGSLSEGGIVPIIE